jgi:hypothetical protein
LYAFKIFDSLTSVAMSPTVFNLTSRSCWPLAIGAAFFSFSSANGEPGKKFYAERVFSILEERCFSCHGGEDRIKGHFRITNREGLLRGGDYGPGYNPESPMESLVLEMLSYKDAEHEMPPKAKLPDEEIAVLRQWVEMGVPYDPALEIDGKESEVKRGFTLSDENREWWAYRPLVRKAIPEVNDAEWSGNGVDAFIRAELDKNGMSPNALADPGVLVRRLFYDLLGLPPKPEEVSAFILASRLDPDRAYRELVDDLLSRPQYGERWARHWLDVVRYAESNGFERDNPKPHIWRYRDYVIDAFNQNKPYDVFLTEQLAGDEIENPTMESMAATGYHRLMQWDDEPADRRQHVYDVLADNVLVTSEAFMAMTLNCARCHDHKADPISQKDFYSFMANFSGVTHYQTPGTIVHWAPPEEKAAFEKQRSERLKELNAERESLKEKIVTVLSEKGVVRAQEGEKVTTFVDDARGKSAQWFYTTSTPTDDWKEVGFLNKSWFKGYGGFGAGSSPNSHVKSKWDTPDIWMRANFGLKNLPESLVLEIYHDEDAEVYLNGALVYEAKGQGIMNDYQIISLSETALDLLQTGKNVIAVHCRQSGGGQYVDLALRSKASFSSIESLLSGGAGKKMKATVADAVGRDLVGEYEKTVAAINGLRQQKSGVPLNVVTEKATPGAMHIHLRGSAHALGDEVAPGVPAVLGSENSDPSPLLSERVNYGDYQSSGRRLALARWMTGEGKALTSRVMVNRIWQHHFGRGIVASSSDFGTLGEKPTHPELLDWLAAEFIRGEWSIKDLHRLILNSRTYRLSSEPDSANLAADPQNYKHWRFSMRRLTAEELRDSILAMSGKLNLKAHGHWVTPPLPAEVLATASRPGKGWPVSADENDNYRRSIYVHVKRSLRHQMLADFDQADTDAPCAVRFATTVPTQALTMLNSEFVNENAVRFADRLRERGGSLEEQIAYGLSLVLQRNAEVREIEELVGLYNDLKTDANLSDRDALDRVALLALNLNEFVYLD